MFLETRYTRQPCPLPVVRNATGHPRRQRELRLRRRITSAQAIPVRLRSLLGGRLHRSRAELRPRRSGSRSRTCLTRRWAVAGANSTVDRLSLPEPRNCRLVCLRGFAGDADLTVPKPLNAMPLERANSLFMHPIHQEAYAALVRLITDLRQCRGYADYYDFQRELLAKVLDIQEYRLACRRVVRRLHRVRLFPSMLPISAVMAMCRIRRCGPLEGHRRVPTN